MLVKQRSGYAWEVGGCGNAADRPTGQTLGLSTQAVAIEGTRGFVELICRTGMPELADHVACSSRRHSWGMLYRLQIAVKGKAIFLMHRRS